MKKIVALLIMLCMLCSFTACSGDETVDSGSTNPTSTDTPSSPDQKGEVTPQATETPEPETDTADTEWVIYWYLCGSDLESGNGFATGDINELLEVTLPDNVKVVIQTGGSSVWHNDYVNPSVLQRFVYDSDGFYQVDEQPLASMGDPQTLADFLYFANKNYPAEKTAVVFWNHGGGSVSGAAFDELYGNDSLTLDEMYAAFSSVWDVSIENPPLELVGFDTCLMATVDVAALFSDISSYLVASEETEPANGWLYSGWVGALAENPSLNGAEIGQIICDTYYEGCQAVGTEQNTTLALIDLSKVGDLLTAYDAFGAECLAMVAQDPGFFSQFARAAISSENYGGNTKEEGYTNMVDLGDLAAQSTEMLATAQPVLDALEDCVLYKVSGEYRANANGLSCYYSYNGDINDYNGYVSVGTGVAFKYYYAYSLTGELDENGMAYIADLDIDVTELQSIPSLENMGWDGAFLDLTEDGVAYMVLGEEAQNVLSSIGFQLYYINPDSDTMMLLGSDNDIIADWDNGIFYDNFRGVWGAIDNNLVYMELSYEGEDYNRYSVPILLNGDECSLQVVYDFTTEEWSILGAWHGIDENGMADKEMQLLQVGDEITTIWKMASYYGEDDFEMYTAATFNVTENTVFHESPLADGSYRMIFEMSDVSGNYVYSSAAQYDCENGEIYTTVFDAR